MELDTVIASIDYLPPTAMILPKLQKVLRDEESGVEEIAALIKVDASLTAEIIRIRNSAYFGSPTQSRNIHEAISRLGYSKIYRTVSMIVVKEILGKALPVYKLKQGELWEHSILTATMMEGLANELGEDSDTAYTTGLVHNLGKIPIDRIVAKDIECQDQLNGLEILTHEIEERILGFHYAEVGSALLRKWKFSLEICMAILFQIKPLASPFPNPFASMLNLTNSALSNRGSDYSIATTCDQYDPEIIDILDLTESTLLSCAEKANERLFEISALVSMV